jgi:hypothetical protein
MSTYSNSGKIMFRNRKDMTINQIMDLDLNPHPEYQRLNVWPKEMDKEFIDSINNDVDCIATTFVKRPVKKFCFLVIGKMTNSNNKRTALVNCGPLIILCFLNFLP